MESIILICIVGFAITAIITPKVKRFLENIGIVGIDVQKKNRPKIATSGGIPVSIGFLSALMCYIFITTYITHAKVNITLLFASLTSILIVVLLMLLDDINILSERKTDKGELDIRIGLKQWQKVLITLLASIPLVVIKSGYSIMSTPFGEINLGIIYPLIIVPLTVIFTSNATNMLAGMNGLEAGIGFVLLFSTGIYSLLFGNVEGGIIAITMSSCLLGFLIYNKYPAKFLPGDTLTYMIGVVFGASIIIGNIEKFGAIVFIPWFIEFFLKARKRFKASSLGILQKDGTLKPKYKKIYSLTHIGMKLVKKEKYIAPLFMCIEACITIIAFVVARW